MSEGKKTAAKGAAAETTTRSRGIRSGVLIGLYQQALEDGVSRADFISLLQRKGAYATRQLARQRLGRFEKEMRTRGLSLVPLAGSSMRRSSKALLSAYSCLVSD